MYKNCYCKALEKKVCKGERKFWGCICVEHHWHHQSTSSIVHVKIKFLGRLFINYRDFAKALQFTLLQRFAPSHAPNQPLKAASQTPKDLHLSSWDSADANDARPKFVLKIGLHCLHFQCFISRGVETMGFSQWQFSVISSVFDVLWRNHMSLVMLEMWVGGVAGYKSG